MPPKFFTALGSVRGDQQHTRNCVEVSRYSSGHAIGNKKKLPMPYLAAVATMMRPCIALEPRTRNRNPDLRNPKPKVQ